MFGIIGNCFSCINKKRAERRPLTLAILGLDNAGKTTTTKSFSGDAIDLDIAPTVGYSYEKFAFDKYDITLYDLGGGKNIRGIWTNYLHEIYGLIYVIDSSASSRMEEAKTNLKEVLDNPNIAGKPLLLLANKQDKSDALDEVDICEQLNLDQIVTANKCPCRIETCSAIKGSGKKMDKTIQDGMKWMLSVIGNKWDQLKNRIDEAIRQEEEKRKIEKAERKKRVEERRREREKQEEEEKKRLGIEDKVSDNETEIDGDPFKKLDVNELKKKEAKMKEQKRKKKELLQKFEEEEKEVEERAIEDSETLTTPRTMRSLGALPSESTYLPQTNSFSSPRSSANPLLPPLQKPLGTKFSDESIKKKKKTKPKTLVEHLDQTEDKNVDSFGLKSMQSLTKIEVRENNLDSGRSSRSHDSNNSSRLGKMLDDDSPSQETPQKKQTRRRKKKKTEYVVSESDTEKENESHPRRQVPPPFIQVVPPSISQTFEDSVEATPPSSHRRKKKNRFLKKRAGTSDDDTTPKNSGRDFTTRTQSPVIDKPHTIQTGIASTNKWGLIDELPEVREEPRRLQAALDDELL